MAEPARQFVGAGLPTLDFRIGALLFSRGEVGFQDFVQGSAYLLPMPEKRCGAYRVIARREKAGPSLTRLSPANLRKSVRSGPRSPPKHQESRGNSTA